MSRWPFTLAGKGFALDITNDQAKLQGPSSTPLIRAQADTGGRPGEGSLNREDFWRRSIISWHHGAGQKVYDGEGSDPYRFLSSQGIDPWTEGELNLLPDVVTVGATPAPGKLIVAPDSDGTYLYHLNGNGTLYEWFSYLFADPVYPAVVTGGDWGELTATDPITDIASDGQYIYAATASDGVFRMDYGAGSLTSYNTVDVSQVWFANNRLLAAKGPKLYNILNTTPPTEIYEHPNEFWYWNGVAGANSYIYLSGAVGWSGSGTFNQYTHSSQIFMTTVTNDEAAELDPPIIAAQLPDGETVQTIYGYAGYIFIGSNRGVRMAQPDSSGFLTYGELLPLGNCTAFEGEENFVWVGASDPSETSIRTNLWRLDLRWFNSPLAPAYARDMESTSAAVIVGAKSRYDKCYVASIATFEGRRIWTQYGNRDSLGADYGYMFLEGTGKVATGGILRSGAVRFDLVEQKRPVSYTVSHHPLDSTTNAIQLNAYHDYVTSPHHLTAEGGVVAGTITTKFDGILSGVPTSRQYTSLDLSLSFFGDNVVTGITMKARPAPERSKSFIVPVLVQTDIEDLERNRVHREVADDLAYLMGYAESGLRADITLLGLTFTGYVEDYQFIPDGMTRWDRYYKGTLLLKIREVD